MSGLRSALFLHFWGIPADCAMLPATRLEVTAHSEYDRRYDGPDGTLRHCVLDTPASKQVRRRNDGERDDKRNEKPTNPKQCSHAKTSFLGQHLSRATSETGPVQLVLEGTRGRRAAWLPGIADRENLPGMAVRLAPINGPAAMVGIDPHVHRTQRSAAIVDSGCFETRENCVEVSRAYPEGEMPFRERLGGLSKIEGQFIADIHGREWADVACFRPRHAKQLSDETCRRDLVGSWDDDVIKLDRHEHSPVP